MKSLKLGLMAFLLSGSIAHALNPITGWYAGFIVGGSKPPDINFNVIDPIELKSGLGVLTYSVLGNLGGQLGYRVNQFRVEGEFFYNNNPYKHLEIDGLNIPNNGSPATTIQQLSIQSKTVPNPFTFTGYTQTFALMFNGIYDIYIPNYTEHVVPYVGAGIGYEQVKNSILFFNNGTATNTASSESGTVIVSNNFAGQAIVGLSYFLTEYTSFSFDYRYLSSTRADKADSQRNSFTSRPQLYSVNFVFNSAFNLA